MSHQSKVQEAELFITKNYSDLVGYDMHIYLQFFKCQTFYKTLTFCFHSKTCAISWKTKHSQMVLTSANILHKFLICCYVSYCSPLIGPAKWLLQKQSSWWWLNPQEQLMLIHYFLLVSLSVSLFPKRVQSFQDNYCILTAGLDWLQKHYQISLSVSFHTQTQMFGWNVELQKPHQCLSIHTDRY